MKQQYVSVLLEFPVETCAVDVDSVVTSLAKHHGLRARRVTPDFPYHLRLEPVKTVPEREDLIATIHNLFGGDECA